MPNTPEAPHTPPQPGSPAASPESALNAQNTTAGAGQIGPRENAETQAPSRSTRGAASTQLDDWLAIEPDGTVLVKSGKVELGTGVRTALMQIVAEELDLPLARLRMVMGDTGATPNEGYTAGSKTIQMGGVALRNAAAEARLALLEAAAEHLEAHVQDLEAHDGIIGVVGSPSRHVTYAELQGGKPFARVITGTAPRKPPADYTLAGTSAARVDLPPKFLGEPAFLQDLRLPGMLHARLVRPPSVGAELLSFDPASVPYVRVVRNGNFVAVVAEREVDAIRAMSALKIEWREQPALPPMDQLYTLLQTTPSEEQTVEMHGDLMAGWSQAAHRFEATYYQPYQAHASIGPSCAVAAPSEDGGLTIWSNTQGVYPLRAALAGVLGMPEDRLRVIYMEAAGCYGQNGSDDAAADAAVLARELGVPIRVQWTREQEFVWEPKSPAMVLRVAAGVDAGGRICAWERDTWSPSHANRGRGFITAHLMNGTPQQTAGSFFLGGDRNEPTNYTLPAARTTIHYLRTSPLRASSMRTLGAFANTFANECAMDELAALAGADPLDFRLAHLDDPRARDVLRAAAESAGWGTPLPEGEGRGIAFIRYENNEAYVATVAHLRVDETSGAIRLLKLTYAQDCGLIINPDGVRNQVEGNAIQSASRALKEEIRFDEYRVLSRDWESYPILTFTEIPEIEIVLINRPDEPSVGVGEPAGNTAAPAIANAVYAARGIRLHQIPFTSERVRAALAARGSR